MECKDKALSLIRESLDIDLFNYGCRYEQYLITHDQTMLNEIKTMLRHSSQNYDELALDYLAAGLTEEAEAIWEMAISEEATSPMTY